MSLITFSLASPVCRSGVSAVTRKSERSCRARKKYWCNDIVIIIIIIDERTATLTIPVWGWWWRTRASLPIYRSWTFDWRATVTIRTRTRRSGTSNYFSGSVWKTRKITCRDVNGDEILIVCMHYCRQQVFHERRRRQYYVRRVMSVGHCTADIDQQLYTF